MGIEPNIAARRMIQVFAQNQTANQRRNVVIFGLMPQHPQIALLDVDVARAQIVQNDAKQRRIAVDEYGTVVIAQAGYAAAEQRCEECVRHTGQCLA